MSEKSAVYVCSGCGIGDCLDVERLAQLATERNVPIVRTSAAFCLEDARLIAEDVESAGVDGVVVAACSPRVNTEVFDFPEAFVERVNIRELVAWSHEPNEEETQALAEDYLRMGLERTARAKKATPHTEANQRTVLVVGGGPAGIAAASGASGAGYDVVLVEKSAELGGYARRMHKQYPKRAPYEELESVDIDAAVAEVESASNVKVLTGAVVAEISGEPGDFQVSVRRNGATDAMRVGAVVMATGWVPPDPNELTRWGVGSYANAVTSLTLEEMAAKGEIRRPSDGGAVKRAAIVLPDDPADDSRLAYGGNVSSLVALKQATYIREQHPDAIVYVLYRDMQTPGLHEYYYRAVQADEGVLFARSEVGSVSEDEGHNIVLELDNTVLGGSVRVAVDLLVVSVGMEPATLHPDESGSLNLSYLQGAELPTNQHGFADSNFICFPYETRRTGIYSAGAVRHPMDLAGSVRDATAAALKAIQCIEQSSAGSAVHPRVGDLSYPEFFMQRCTSCGRCTQECPFGALGLDDINQPVLDTNRCRRCGICMGACPVQIISFSDYSVDMLSAMVSAVEIPEDDEDKPRILVFACENDAYPALDMAGVARQRYSAAVRVIPVRCLGSVNSILVADAMSSGFDGVALMGCKSGDDYQCHFIQGSELLTTRMDNVRETLDRLMLETERVQVMEVEISDSARVPELIQGMVDTVARIGLNPMKGF